MLSGSSEPWSQIPFLQSGYRLVWGPWQAGLGTGHLSAVSQGHEELALPVMCESLLGPGWGLGVTSEGVYEAPQGHPGPATVSVPWELT